MKVISFLLIFSRLTLWANGFRWDMEQYNLIRVAASPDPYVLEHYPDRINYVPAPAPICQPPVIFPAVDCGCYAYRPLYKGLHEWMSLRRLCKKLLKGSIESGKLLCKNTTFATENEDGIEVNERKMNRYFRNSNKTCSFYSERMPPLEETERYEEGLTTYLGAPTENTMTVLARPKYEVVHNRLARMCLVAASVKGINKKKAYKRCCPGAPRRSRL